MPTNRGKDCGLNVNYLFKACVEFYLHFIAAKSSTAIHDIEDVLWNTHDAPGCLDKLQENENKTFPNASGSIGETLVLSGWEGLCSGWEELYMQF